VQWADSDAGEFLFALGDCSKWLVAECDQVIGWYDNGMRTMMNSSNGATQARWYRRSAILEDPWISITDHETAEVQGDILYGGNSYEGNALALTTASQGANVFIRSHRNGACSAWNRSEPATGAVEPVSAVVWGVIGLVALLIIIMLGVVYYRRRQLVPHQLISGRVVNESKNESASEGQQTRESEKTREQLVNPSSITDNVNITQPRHRWPTDDDHAAAPTATATMESERIGPYGVPADASSWEAVQDAGGKTYWWNTETDEVTWSDPHVQAP
jgi:hypothetical protein